MKRFTLIPVLVILLAVCLLGVIGCDTNEKTPSETTSEERETTAPKETEATETVCSHNYELISSVENTCLTDGEQIFICPHCGSLKIEPLPATGHSYQSTTTLATMTADGEVRSVCASCGETKVQVLPAMEKDAVAVDSLTEHVVGRENGFVYLDVQSDLISLGGIAAPANNNGEYYRFVASNKNRYPGDIKREGGTTAGGTLRFRISGGSFRLKAVRRTDLGFVNKFGTYAFDIYVGSGIDRTLLMTVSSPFRQDFESETITLPEGVQEVMICLPYNMGFSDLQIAFEEGAYIAAPPARTGGIIGLYGSSITQGYDGSSPSRSYAMQLCLAMDADCVNFGLSGSARGEKVVINDMCAKIKDAGITTFILDYDWNINSYGELRFGNYHAYAHSTIYEKLREALGPGVPILMLSRPYFGPGTGGVLPTTMNQCIGVIRNTCDKATAAGDYAVAFISGKTEFFGDEGASCHGDKVHPNNKGHKMMAAKVKSVLEQLLANS